MSRRSRKKQLEELEQQLQALRSELYSADVLSTDRLVAIETIVEGHDATLDVASRALESYPPPTSLASVGQVQDLAEQQTAARAEQQNSLADLQTTITGQEAVIAEQRATIAALKSRLDEVESRTAAQAARVEARLGEITQQVLHQVEELSTEVDAASRLAQEAVESTGMPGGLLDELKAAQARLANEQVRYDLALRAELAELADRLRRSGRG